MIKGVLLGEEVFQFRVSRQRCLVEEADISPSTKPAKVAGLVGAADGNGFHRRVVLPFQQDGGQATHHVQVQCIQRLRTV